MRMVGKMVATLIAAVTLAVLIAAPSVWAQQGCFTGGHVETSEDLSAAGSWGELNQTPGGGGVGGIAASHLVISEVAPRGFGTGVPSDSSEYVEIYNPTPSAVSLDHYYISDDIGYYKIVNGPYPATNASDYALKFPDGLTLFPGRTILLCVTKAGYASSGGFVGGAAQHFLEMRDSNANPADDMVIITPNSSFLVTGGMFTNPSLTGGEWVVLYCWNGVSDLVCDVDYASWGNGTAASNPKMDKTGVSIDGPDANAAVSAYAADVPMASQTNLGSGTPLTKPLSYQRGGPEIGENPMGGNGCRGRISPTQVDWTTDQGVVRFHVRWTNTDTENSSDPVEETIFAQAFGVFLPDQNLIHQMTIPPLQPNSFFDVFFEVPLSALPPSAPTEMPGGGPGVGGPCPPPDNWNGNLDIIWSGPGYTGQVEKHYGELLICPGAAPSYIHVSSSNCPVGAPWTIAGLCGGFNSTLVNEDKTPAPNPVPPGWSGWICVSAAAGTPVGLDCCFTITFACNGVPATIDICATTCNWSQPGPTLALVDWVNIGSDVRFHQRWENRNPAETSLPVSGDMMSQEFGVFLPDFGLIGHFDVPPMAPNSFFDVFFDVPLASLPPEPPKELPGGGPPTGGPACPPSTQWNGNVDIIWNGPGGTGQIGKHYGDLLICPGAPPSYIHVRSTNCPVDAPWAINGLCPGFNATLVNEDKTPAPNPIPPGWTGWICVSAAAGMPVGVNCCFTVDFLCNGSPAVIDLCAITCDWQVHNPTLAQLDWVTLGSDVRFHMRWENMHPAAASGPISGGMMSQEFGVFLPDFGPIGSFSVPPIAPSSFFDVFIDIPLTNLPPPPPKELPGGGPQPGGPCPPPINEPWDGNVDVNWNGPGGSGQVNKHVGNLYVCPGAPPSYIHMLTFCNSPVGATWSITELCPGFNATLVNEDKSPAPNPVPPGWTGFICVRANAAASVPDTCCFKVNFFCDGVPGVIDLCAITCNWSRPSPTLALLDWVNVGSNVRFHQRWENMHPTAPSDPISGDMMSQPFGVFQPNFGPIGHFDVPPIPPNSFFDIFFDVPIAQLPPEPEKELPGGGPPAGSNCPPSDAWNGNVDLIWGGAGGSGTAQKHQGDLLVNLGSTPAYIHVGFTNCPVPSPWTITGLCPGFSATLVNEDKSPAPNPIPPFWSGWICVSASAGIPGGTTCCIKVNFDCDGAPGVIDLCATSCQWLTSDVRPVPGMGEFGIFRAAPNPSSTGMVIDYVLPEAGTVQVDVFDLSGRRVRSLMNGVAQAGVSSVRWDGLGENGSALPPGTYFIKLDLNGRSSSRKVVITH